ncbi:MULTISPECIES: uracil-xanthine permease family protein [unclassified Oceanispirochaeta]|uniref:uracil-xanthine permease family protein n=1 Tax=unclassified Oceanispirochaeta TaxID=2635722 RepID=UPI000E09566C|nr:MULTISPECIES: nucleobase:cation symporter-2 family protein [unclassified Oceanispirochaeta]MBF9018704.1 purine permease [Oceanispirochaeta sp. M2]NPD75142.1 purine permease [Oceanispirochaeta sp. M1]RDG28995.1 purine permease [Oceanispirochaeta sp. M1]
MSDASKIQSEMIYTLEDKPPAGQAFLAALQHMMAIFIGIVTPAIVISGALGLSTEMSSYLISMSLFVSGIATFIQIKKIGPIGSGLLSIQGTSFTFLSLCIGIGFTVKNGGGTEAQMLAAIFGTCLIASPVEMIFSRFIPMLKKIITPLVSGIVVTLIGMSLIKVGITDIGGGAWLLANKPDVFANSTNLILAAIVLVTIIVFNRSSNKWLRMGSIVFGLIAGYVVASFMGLVQFGKITSLKPVALPIPFKYGFGISWAHVIPMALLYLITTVESIGDLTATSMVSGEPVEGDVYMKRISGGVFGDGVNSALAAVFNSFPNTTFSQNNGVIQMTGVASRYVGFWISGLLVLFGLFPIVGGLFSIIPNAVLGGATIIMFGTVAASGIRIISSSIIDRRGVIIMALSFGLGLGVVFVPQILNHFPPFLQSVFSSAITTGGLIAIFLNIVLPRSYKDQKVDEPMKDMV